MTDAVITYVNPTDAEWQAEWERVQKSNPAWAAQNQGGARWRDFGTLPYLIEGIELYMPWVRKIHIIVSDKKQVRQYAFSDKVHIVEHAEIMPDSVLPTFNSTVIELFMYRIPDLAEQFIYFNDDMFPVGAMREEDFFIKGRPAILKKVEPHPARNPYECHMKNGYYLASRITGRIGIDNMRFGHSAMPMLKSTWIYLWHRAGKELMRSCTPFRTIKNINQDVAAYFHYLSGRYVASQRKLKYTTTAKRDMAERAVRSGCYQIVCINDVKACRDDAGLWMRPLLSEALGKQIVIQDDSCSDSESGSESYY